MQLCCTKVTKQAFLNACPGLSSFQHRIVTGKFRLHPNLVAGKCAFFVRPAWGANQQRNKTWHLSATPRIMYGGHFSQTAGLLQQRLMCMYSALRPFSVSSLLTCHGCSRWFPMDPMWWMLLMKSVNLKSPAGYSGPVHKAVSSPIQCSLHTDRGRPREKWGDGIGFEALRQVIKSNTPTHQGMWFPQVPLADMLNFLL